jgi:membrane protease YdiL (CAAX protease family)
MMDTHLNNKRLWIFLAFAVGVPWLAALVLYLTLGRTDLGMAGMVTNMIFISTPMLANIATRLITREGWKRLWLWPKFRRGWPFYLAAIFLPFLATIVGIVIFFLVFPGSLDPNLGEVRKLYGPYSVAESVNPWRALLIITLMASLGWLFQSGLLSIGEDFGWRAYLLPKLVARFSGEEPVPGGSFQPSAARKASIVVGLIWSVWHWPMILMGIFTDPSMTLPRVLAYLGLYVVSVCGMSVFLCWVTLRSGSVWPAAIGHGLINGTSAIPPVLLKGTTDPLLGPGLPGVLGLLGYFALALVLLFNRRAFTVREEAGSARVRVAYSTLVE